MNHVNNILNKLISDQSNTCISIFLPAHPTMPGRKPDVVLVHSIMQQLSLQLRARENDPMASSLIEKVERLAEQIDLNIGVGGSGIFVSKENEILFHFDVAIDEKIAVADTFLIRDLVLQQNYAEPYLVLHVSQNNVRLYKGLFNVLTEITDINFPRYFEDEFEYQPPSRGSSYVGSANTKQFEKDKGLMMERRFEKFLREVDILLSQYLEKDIRLIVAGEIQHISSFNATSRHVGNVSGQLEGNYNSVSKNDFSSRVWSLMREYIVATQQKELEMAREKPSLTTSGLQQIWQLVNEGRGDHLMVEKGYKAPGFVDSRNSMRLDLRPPRHAHKVFADIVNELMAITISKGGRVSIVEDDMLSEFGRAMLLLRY